MHSIGRLLIGSGFCGLLSVSCAPPPTVVTPRPVHTQPPTPTATATPCSDEPTEAQDLMEKGKRIQAAKPDEALALYERAARLEPNSAPVQYRIGMVYQRRNDWDNAVAAFGRATRLDPSFANYWMWYGYSLEKKALRDRRGWQDARDALEKCIAIDENFSECHHRLGYVYMYMDEERKALESYTKSIRLEPTNIGRYAALADFYLNLDFVDEAETVLKEAKKFAKPGERSLFWIHVLMSEVHNLRGAAAERITELEAASLVANDDGPEAVQILFMLGSTYAVSNPPRREKAITNLQGFLERGCKGSKASYYTVECGQAQTLISRMRTVSP